MSTKLPVLPPLLFGEKQAVRHVDSRSLGDQIQATFPGLNGYDPLGNPSHFFALSSAVNLPGLKVVTSSMSASRVDRDGYQEMTLMIPLVGTCMVTALGKTLHWGAGLGGVFIPEMDGQVQGEGDERSLVLFNLRADRLDRTARAMAGLPPDKKLELNLEEPRLIPLAMAGMEIETVFRQLGGLIDYHQLDPQRLSLFGFSDIFYRYIVSLLNPELIAPAKDEKAIRVIRLSALDQVCDAMKRNLAKKWTLTELELLSSLSARALQYAFKARFGCSPMDWLREERLQQARKRILLQEFESMTQLSDECGFSNPSQFGRYYKNRFGITPSQTRR